MKKITHCRACGSKALTPAFSMEREAGARWFRRGGDVEYVLCDPSKDSRACGLLQSSHENAQPEFVPSGKSRSNRDHLRAVATESLELISGRDCSALDIGCNDGTLLSYYPRWVERFGIDSSAEAGSIGAWAKTIRETFPSQKADEAIGLRKFDIITAVSILEHIDNPRAFIYRVKSLLANDGVFALETLYAPMTLTRNSIETLQSGVCGLYSLSVLEWLLREAGLKIFKGALTEKEGGSIRLFICHSGVNSFDFDPWSERLARLWDEENALAMRALQPCQSFERRAVEVRTAFCRLLDDMAARGENAHILGADAKTASMLEWLGPSAKVITAAVDPSGARAGERVGDANIRVITETDCRAAEPDYLIAPSQHKQEMLERWREAILLGARMVFLSPTPHIVTSVNFATEFGKSIAGGERVGGIETLRSILSAAGGPRLVADNDRRKAAS